MSAAILRLELDQAEELDALISTAFVSLLVVDGAELSPKLERAIDTWNARLEEARIRERSYSGGTQT